MHYNKAITNLIITDLKNNILCSRDIAIKHNTRIQNVCRIRKHFKLPNHFTSPLLKTSVINWSDIQKYYDENHSIIDCQKYCKEKYGRFLDINKAKKLKLLKTRKNYETLKLKKYTRVHSTESKKKLSEAMKIRRANGYDWTLAHIKRQPSYPEKWFKKVIENEFNNKQYVTELRQGRYSLDFAWEKNKKVIEIDGEQHYTKKEQIESDIRKDLYLQTQGWTILRIRWKKMFKDPEIYIEQAKKFIEN